MNNAVDLIQIFSIRAGKNRADIRMALDALEVAIQRAQIDTFVILSGDSDFGPLVTKLREYGRYTLGIGPREVTHPLLVRACDEFVYLEVALGEMTGDAHLSEPPAADVEAARQLLLKALRVHAQRNELPVLAAKLKQTMLLLDGAFTEAAIGHTQFKTWLEQNTDILTLFVKDHQLYVAPREFSPTPEWSERPWSAASLANGQSHMPAVGVPTVPGADAALLNLSLRQQYNQIFTRLKMTSVDFATRRDVLRDIYHELCERYETQGLIRSKTTLRQIWQMGFRQRAFDYRDQVASVHVSVWLDGEIDSEAAFVQRAESGFVYAVVNAGLEIDKVELALILLNDGEHTEYIDSLLDDLEQRGLVIESEGRYMLPGHSSIPFADEPALQPIIYDIENMQLPDSMARGFEKARSLAKTAMLQRSQDFAASARSYLMACRLQWDAVETGEPGATLEDLRWYMASYASVRAGELSQIHRDYAHSRPYYLAFFFLVQEDDPLWSRMRGLINPMLSYYWVNAWRELGLNAGNPSLNATTPAEIAVRAATHETPDLCSLWYAMSNALAEVNPGLVRRVASQIRLNRGESPTYAQVADTLEQMLMQ
jgi:hypothetical protein